MAARPLRAEIARALIACRSVTPADAGALPYLKGMLDAAGFQTELVAFAEPDAAISQPLGPLRDGGAEFRLRRPYRCRAAGRSLAMALRPVRGRVADGKLYGRGACDMKGGVAASVAAALDFFGAGAFDGFDQLSHHRRRGGAGGQRHRQVARMGARARRTLRPLRARRAHQRRRARRRGEERPARLADRPLKLIGKQGHVAYPHLADNPLPPALRALDALQSPAARRRHRRFRRLNLEVVTVDVGNPATNVIPGEASSPSTSDSTILDAETLTAEIEAPPAAALPQASLPADFRSFNAVAFLTAARRLHRSRCARDPRCHWTRAQAFDQRRHLGRALHQGRLPGDRIRSRRRLDAWHRRTRETSRHGKVDAHL